MKAYRFDALTDVSDLNRHEEAEPRPQRGEVLVKVQAVALNYRDLAIVLGTYVQTARAGVIPCSDAAGEVLAVGEGVIAFKPGDRVISVFHPRWFGGRPPLTMGKDQYGSVADGWLVQRKVVSQEALVRLPDALSYEEGATLPCAATTAWTALSGPTPIRAGMTVLTLGTGGVSIFAVQLAKALGAQVLATTSSDAKAERLRALGAAHVVLYTAVKDWGLHIRRTLTAGAGVDCVVEVGGPATVNQSLKAVRWGGEVVLIGFLSQDNPGMDYFDLKASGAVVRSIGVGDRAALEDVVRAVKGSGLKPVIDRVFPFEDARGAFEHLKGATHVGKVVITLDP